MTKALYGKSKKNGTAAGEKAKMTADKPKTDPVLALYWREIERYDRATNTWREEGDQITDVYLDESRVANSTTRRFALLWANVETLKPAVYTKAPTILCTRRFKDRDQIGSIAGELMERATNSSFDLYKVDETFRMVRDDRLLPGRGQGWVRYEAILEQYDDPDGTIDNDSGEVVKHERLASEKVCVDYVHWKDFGHNVARTWSEVWIVWRVCFKTQAEMTERFGSEIASQLSYNAKMPAQGSGSITDDPDGRCKVYEVWDKTRRQTVWMAEGHASFLEQGPPPIDFRDGFPCPEPCYATKSTKELIPRPDYRYYKDQAKEINDLTDKIGRLTQWLIVKGFVPAGPSSVADPLEEALRDKTNAELFVQVESMTEWTEKGGAGKIIDWLPIDKVVQALQAAISARAQLIQDVFQITGISDVLRGQTDPNETLGAQELKAQTGTRRLRNTKDEIARFCRDMGQLVAEVIAEKFEPKSIAEITGFKYIPPAPPMPPMLQLAPPMGTGGMPMPPNAPMSMMAPPQQETQEQQLPPQSFDDRVMELLRNDKMRSYRVDVETDSTIQPDENAEKQSRVEFANMASNFLKQGAEALIAAPELAPAMGEILGFTARGFRVGRGMEETLEKSFENLVKSMQKKQAAAAQQPDPEMLKLRQKDQNDKATLALKAQGQNTDAALTARKQDLDFSAELRDQNLAAVARAKERVAKVIGATAPKPTGKLQ